MNHDEEFNIGSYDNNFSQEPLFQDLDYQEEEEAEHDGAGHHGEDDEAEGESGTAKNKKPIAKYALFATGAIAVLFGGVYVAMPEMLGDIPAQVVAMVTGETVVEPEPDPVVQKPSAKKHPKPASGTDAKPADGDAEPTAHAPKPPVKVAAKHPEPPKPEHAKEADHKKAAAAPKPEDDPEFKTAPAANNKKNAGKSSASVSAKPEHKAPPVVKKPATHSNVVAGAMPAAAKTSVAFQRNSYWVSAAEVEHLWSFASHLKGNSGQFTVESWVGSERDALNLSRKRANRVAELLSKNTVPNAFKVTVKVHGTSNGGSSNKVSVSYTSGSKL